MEKYAELFFNFLARYFFGKNLTLRGRMCQGAVNAFFRLYFAKGIIFGMNLLLFDKWNKKKKVAHQRSSVPFFEIGEIWWTQLGKNIASESLGKGNDFLRPVIVLQKFYGTSAHVIPLTSQKKTGTYYFAFRDSNMTEQTALLPQVRYIDGKRFYHRLSIVPEQVFDDLRSRFFELIKNNP